MKVYTKYHKEFDALSEHQKKIQDRGGKWGWRKENGGYLLFYCFDAPKYSQMKQLIATRPITVFIEKNSANLPLEKTNIGKIPEERRERLSWKGCYYTIKPREEFFFRDTNQYDLSHFILNNGLDFKVEVGDPFYWLLPNEVIIK